MTLPIDKKIPALEVPEIPVSNTNKYTLPDYVKGFENLVNNHPDILDSDVCPKCRSINILSLTQNDLECYRCGHIWAAQL